MLDAGTSWMAAVRRQFQRDVLDEPVISAVGAWAFTALISVAIGLSAVFAPHVPDDGPESVIPLSWGLMTAAFVIVVAWLLAWSPVIARNHEAMTHWLNSNVFQSPPLAQFAGFPPFILRVIDFVLVRFVAPAAGAGAPTIWVRYVWFGGLMLACLLVAWFAKDSAGGVWVASLGILAVLAVVRRWHWIEHDRSEFIVSGGQQRPKIGFAQDLRDEALIAISCLVVLIPLLLRQLDHAYNWFSVAGDADDFWSWLGFFGAELAKAIPFIDWSEVFGVANGSPIGAATTEAAVVVFALRATLDLILLTAILEAVQIATRLGDQARRFVAGDLALLDPFAEWRSFRKHPSDRYLQWYQRSEDWPSLAALRRYSRARLEAIVRGDADGGTTPILADQNARMTALTILARQHARALSVELVASIQERSDSSVSGVRTTAFRMAAEGDASFGIACLRHNGPDWLTSWAMLECARRKDESAMTRLRELSATASPSVRRQALAALARLGDGGAKADLLKTVAADVGDSLICAYAVSQVASTRERKAYVRTPDQILHAALDPRTVATRDIDAASYRLPRPEVAPTYYTPIREVETQGFLIGIRLVTHTQFDAFCLATGRTKLKRPAAKLGRKPVRSVTWAEAQEYCAWLCSFSGEHWRLPTEAEWEVASHVASFPEELDYGAETLWEWCGDCCNPDGGATTLSSARSIRRKQAGRICRDTLERNRQWSSVSFRICRSA